MSETINILQWNIDLTYRDKTPDSVIRSRLEVLESLVKEYSPNVAAIQEADYNGIKDPFPSSIYDFYIDDGLVTAYDKNYWHTPSLKIQSSRYAILHFQCIEPPKKDVLITHLHARSQLHGDKSDPERSLIRIDKDLERIRSNIGRDIEEIIIGDFNVKPYNQKITSREILASHRSIPHVYSRTKGREIAHRPMYNPTWRFFGRSEGALGTYYYSSTNHGTPWTIFDQVLVTDGLIYSGEDAIELITEVGQYRLVNDSPKCVPNEEVGSDHLPVVARIVHEAGIPTG